MAFRRRLSIRAVAVGAFAAGVGLGCFAATASATGTLTVTPDTGLVNGQNVTITGSGFAHNSSGNILECNDDPNEPSVSLGPPVNSNVSVGCTAPALSASVLLSTSATGTVSKTYPVATGTIGPPCGASGDLVSTCPSTDSAGQNPTTDAANYPCPPTAAQQADGVTCSLHFGDQANDTAQATIQFQGESTATTTTGAATSTTASPTTTSGTGSATTATPTTDASPTSTPSGSLAYTGPGPQLWWLALIALALVCLGMILWLVAPKPAGSSARDG